MPYVPNIGGEGYFPPKDEVGRVIEEADRAARLNLPRPRPAEPTTDEVVSRLNEFVNGRPTSTT